MSLLQTDTPVGPNPLDLGKVQGSGRKEDHEDHETDSEASYEGFFCQLETLTVLDRQVACFPCGLLCHSLVPQAALRPRFVAVISS